jgi:hypothetical protein
VAKRNSGRRGRSRKRRGVAQAGLAAGAEGGAPAVAEPAAERGSPAHSRARPANAGRRGAAERGATRFSEQLAAFGERPRAPWHPLPLSELVILVGLIGAVVGVARGASGRAVLFTGIGAVAIGTIEFTVREHLSGYRPHTTLLAFLPVAVFHSAAAVGLVALGSPRAVWLIAPLVLDVPLFAILFKLLRGRFLDARQERRLAAGR